MQKMLRIVFFIFLIFLFSLPAYLKTRKDIANKAFSINDTYFIRPGDEKSTQNDRIVLDNQFLSTMKDSFEHQKSRAKKSGNTAEMAKYDSFSKIFTELISTPDSQKIFITHKEII